ncbi:MAG: efflux RND transporter periplasmic adaptor subunit [Bacteroidales bacterium]|nr:MAG: efflux RND transporter periplasmic adaptor subunit [Bacteroidales bacterium]
MKRKSLISISKREALLTVITLVLGLLIGGLFFGGSGDGHDGHEHEEVTGGEETSVYTCSMHPQIRQNEPGLCPICAMDLVPLATMQQGGDDTDPNEVQMTESAMKLADVQTSVVVRRIPEKSIHLLGKVKADERNVARLTARFGGRIEKLFVNFTGQNVTKGQKLGSIYSPDLITAQKELLEAVKFRDTNPSFYLAARSKLKLWDLTEEQIRSIENSDETLMYFDVLSPISGTITNRFVAAGDYVKEGSVLFEVINLTKVWVMFDAYESDLPWIKTGDEVKFTLQSIPGETYRGKVAQIDPFIDPNSRVARVRVEIANPNLTLKPEMFARGILESGIAGTATELLIPKSSVLWTGKRAVVYVKVPDRQTPSFLYREITLGPEAGNYYVVREGLSEGEEIATNGVFKIDASAQLAGKASMMNPDGGMVTTGHNHGTMENESSLQEHSQHPASDANLSHEMFTVSGNCGMCKDRIEKASLSLDGVKSAEWDEVTKIIHISYDKELVKLRDIHKAIAKAGHDTEKEKAPDEVYNALPECCLYRK